jgi:hypothetical protein
MAAWDPRILDTVRTASPWYDPAMKRMALIVGLVAEVASAEGIALKVEVGKTVEIEVGYARGWMCDDPSLVRAEVVTRGDRNFWIVSGAKQGATQCRVGTDVYGVSLVFDVSVVPSRKRP